MYGTRALPLTKEEYNYLLPALYSKVGARVVNETTTEYYFISETYEDVLDLLRRLTLLTKDDPIEPTISTAVRCFTACSIRSFRSNV